MALVVSTGRKSRGDGPCGGLLARLPLLRETARGLIALTACCGVGGERSRGQAGNLTTGVGRRTRPPTAEHSGSG
jgi:hypothetical protein